MKLSPWPGMKLARMGVMRPNWRIVSGVSAVVLCTAIASLWSFWGAIENFHEGWYYPTLGANLRLAIVQYLCWPIGFAGLGAVGIWKPRVGASVFALIGILVDGLLFHFQNAPGTLLILFPCLLLALLFGFGSVPHRRLVTGIAVGLPLLIISGISVPMGWKVSHRLRLVSKDPLVWKTPSETLEWAPPGPGWPKEGVSYGQALDICARLTSDGRSVAKSPQNLWRLPTVEEAESAMNRGGKPAGCVYNGAEGFQPCRTEPDKEAPLWDPFSQIIYWWTASDDSKGRNLRISYNGYVLPVRKAPTGYTAFRAVRGFAAPASRASRFRKTRPWLLCFSDTLFGSMDEQAPGKT